MNNPTARCKTVQKLYTADQAFLVQLPARTRRTQLGSTPLPNLGTKALTCCGVLTHSGREAICSLLPGVPVPCPGEGIVRPTSHVESLGDEHF
jgi:hypothetical protein